MPAGMLIEGLAGELLTAERTRTPISPLTDSHPGLNEEDAYCIQDALVAAGGEARVGYKLGFTSQAMREQMDISSPNYGRLTGGMRVSPGGSVPLSGLIHPRVEPEVAFLVDRDLEGPGLVPELVSGAVRWACGALEIVDSRYRDYRFRAEDNIADNSSAARFVLGRPVPVATDVRVVLRKDGRVMDEGVGANAMGGPLFALAWLANRLGEAGEVLEAGSIVLTGGLTRAHSVDEGGTFVAEFGELGTVEVHFPGEGG